MRKEIVYKVPYRLEGEDKEVEIKIDFISNRTMKDFSTLFTLAGKAEKAWNRISDINTLIMAEDDTPEVNQKFEIEIEECYSIINEFNDNGYFTQRAALLERILIDNGYKDDELLMSQDFWDECVDPSDLLNFMTKAVYKDVDKKKAVGVV
jgi:hypothetical protein